MFFDRVAIGTVRSFRPNLWDVALLPVVFAVLGMLAYGSAQMDVPYNVGTPLVLSLDPLNLPEYLLRSALRMLAALAASTVFTLIYASLAAKVPALERVLIPILDILQSIPILGFLSITVAGFISLFPGSLLGVECAAVFAIFTSHLSLIHLEKEPAARLELGRQGFGPDSVPVEGQRVLVMRNGNAAFDVTDLVHPSVAETVSLAARVVGLDIAGVDLVAEDISRPLDEQRGAIVEVNAGPGLLMHLKPASGEPRPVGQAIVDSLFPENESGRIPVIGITGTKGKTVVARLVARLLHLDGRHVGLACSDGLYLDRRLVEKGNCATWASAHKILLNRSIEAAVIENGGDAILGEGLAYDRCQVGVVTNIDPVQHFGRYYIDTPEQVFNVLRTQVDVVLEGGVAVLNAGDPLVADMAKLCDGEVIFFGIDPEIPAIAEHRAQGGRAVFVRDGSVVLATGMECAPLAVVALIPLTDAGQVGFQIENVLAAVGVAWALGLSPELIRAGIKTFEVGQTEA